MSNPKTETLIPAPAQLVIDFFDNELADVKFADMDRGVLQEALEQMHVLAEEQARAEAALRAAQDALQAGLDGLLGKCQRALSYARIYAEDDADLSRRLEAIVIPRRNRSGALASAPAELGEARAKRGRPRSTTTAPERERDDGGSLFVEVPGEAPPQKGATRAAA